MFRFMKGGLKHLDSGGNTPVEMKRTNYKSPFSPEKKKEDFGDILLSCMSFHFKILGFTFTHSSRAGKTTDV